MAAATVMASLKLKASWDTQQRLPYNPHRSPKSKKNPNTLTPTKPTQTPPIVTLNTSATHTNLLASQLLNHNTQNPGKVKLEESYLGYERWLPSPPKVKEPRSVYNAASLAYIGDCIYELYARRHFLFPPLNIEEYNDRVMAVVRCEAQVFKALRLPREPPSYLIVTATAYALFLRLSFFVFMDALLQKLLNDNYLSEEERDVLRWGKNISSAKTRTIKRAGQAVYNRASSLETLVGYLYLTNVQRLEEVMLKLGFSTSASAQLILENASSGKQDSG